MGKETFEKGKSTVAEWGIERNEMRQHITRIPLLFNRNPVIQDARRAIWTIRSRSLLSTGLWIYSNTPRLNDSK